RAVALPVLRHRIVTSFNAEADNVSAADIIEQLIKEV
ncbi:MAG TPA: AAA family ATPase, partial [Candidatus Kapabacteria bacterium]|nr:AAA family ATPase [Candidatus Kapabacteria bacterium]